MEEKKYEMVENELDEHRQPYNIYVYQITEEEFKKHFENVKAFIKETHKNTRLSCSYNDNKLVGFSYVNYSDNYMMTISKVK